MTDTREEREGLGRTISIAGLQVSQAADELAQAAERLLDAEGRVHEAEARWQAAEEQIEQGATKNAELLELLQASREGQAAADERSRRAEQRVQTEVERASALEEQVRELEVRLESAEAQPEMTVVLDDERNALQEAVAAEVRRPLTSILGLTLALKHADPKTAEGADMIKQLATNARKLDRLVGEMLDVDKIASGAFTPNLRRTDLEALVRRVIDESPDLHGRDIHIETDHVATEVDPALAEQMIETLLANAGRRTTPGNPVWVKLSDHPDGGAVLSVEDAGPEVPDGLRSALLADASDGGPAARQTPRGATGLSLLARFAALHGGRAWVEERTGGGASFRVLIPAPCREDEAVPDNVLEMPTMDARAAERVRDLGDERALALAKALVAADDEEAAAQMPTISEPQPAATVAGRIAFDEVTGEIRL